MLVVVFPPQKKTLVDVFFFAIIECLVFLTTVACNHNRNVYVNVHISYPTLGDHPTAKLKHPPPHPPPRPIHPPAKPFHWALNRYNCGKCQTLAKKTQVKSLSWSEWWLNAGCLEKEIGFSSVKRGNRNGYILDVLEEFSQRCWLKFLWPCDSVNRHSFSEGKKI